MTQHVNPMPSPSLTLSMLISETVFRLVSAVEFLGQLPLKLSGRCPGFRYGRATYLRSDDSVRSEVALVRRDAK